MSRLSAPEPIQGRHGLAITTAVSVEDFEALGMWWANLGSEQQARFLVGVAAGFNKMATLAAYRQLDWIRRSLEALPRDAVDAKRWVEDLHLYLANDDEVTP